MPLYEFSCDCGEKQEVFASIKEGPPKGIICGCGLLMYQEFSAEFILKGNWPGKSLKGEYHRDQKTSELVDSLDEYDSAKKESNKVLKERRKGRKNYAEFQRHNRPVVERYRKNLKKGIKGE